MTFDTSLRSRKRRPDPTVLGCQPWRRRREAQLPARGMARLPRPAPSDRRATRGHRRRSSASEAEIAALERSLRRYAVRGSASHPICSLAGCGRWRRECWSRVGEGRAAAARAARVARLGDADLGRAAAEDDCDRSSERDVLLEQRLRRRSGRSTSGRTTSSGSTRLESTPRWRSCGRCRPERSCSKRTSCRPICCSAG